MKIIYRRIIICLMVVVLVSLSPLSDLSPKEGRVKAAESHKYIKEFKIGQGEDSEDAIRQLRDGGYTILKDEAGNYADLNEKAGDGEEGRNGGNSDMVVYLGYLTTDNKSEAITDLAVMNMNGGYSFRDYEELVERTYESKIKPFMKEFLKIVKEYRENLKKDHDSLAYLRANSMRETLNRIKDDDCDGAGVGDLLINETKFEMGEAAYNSLILNEKKKHADIVTYFQQGNELILYCLTNTLARAADTADETWIDRIEDNDYRTLEEEVYSENPNMTTREDVENALSAKYEGGARILLKHWEEISEELNDTDAAEETVDNFDTEEYNDFAKEMTEEYKDTPPEDIDDETVQEIGDMANEAYEYADKTVTLTVRDFLEECDYSFKSGSVSGDTLLDLFRLNVSDFDGKNIKLLYPLVASLSDGQIAGLEYLSIRDLIAVAMNDENDYEKMMEDLKKKNEYDSSTKDISLYVGVNREIYDKGGVALTSEILRNNASADVDGKDNADAVAFTYDTLVQGCIKFAEGIAVTALLGLGIGYLVGHIGTVSIVIGCILAVTVIIGGILALLGFITQTSADAEKYNVKVEPIPKYIVDEKDVTVEDKKGRLTLIKDQTVYYKAVKCNRADNDYGWEEENLEVLGDHGDLNGDVGKEWLALYTACISKEQPILADSFVVCKGTSTPPSGYNAGIHKFGNKSVFNLNNKAFLYGTGAVSTYVYFQRDKAETLEEETQDNSVTGSVFSTGSAALGGGIGVVVGGILGFIMALMYKRKKENPEED
ncbi:MAG: hypothetical protein K6G11_02860 [Lachnospiraceae bacterium]|nr:hypothetical protein [Lachnospiraceae bacterium]